MNKSKKLSVFMLIGLMFLILTSAIVSAQYEWTPGGEAAFLGLSTVCCISIAIPWIIWLVLAIWTYKDAEKRGKSGILWFLIVLILGIIGLIIWLVVRPPIGGEKTSEGGGRTCPSCGRPIPMDAQVCPYCGKDFRPPGQK